MEDRNAALAFFGILIGFKVFTLGMIVVLLYSWESASFLIAGHALWVLTAMTLAWIPLLFWLRLLRVRVKRKQLQREEWLVEEDPQRTHP